MASRCIRATLLRSLRGHRVQPEEDPDPPCNLDRVPASCADVRASKAGLGAHSRGPACADRHRPSALPGRSPPAKASSLPSSPRRRPESTVYSWPTHASLVPHPPNRALPAVRGLRSAGARIRRLHLHPGDAVPLPLGGHDRASRRRGAGRRRAGAAQSPQHRGAHHPDGAPLRHPGGGRKARRRERADGDAGHRDQSGDALPADSGAVAGAVRGQLGPDAHGAAVGQLEGPAAAARHPDLERHPPGRSPRVLRAVGGSGGLRVRDPP